MRAVRAILITTICLLVLANFAYFFTASHNKRLTDAINNDAIHPSIETQHEVIEATEAGHRRFLIEQTIVGITLLCLGAGVVFTTTRFEQATRQGEADPGMLIRSRSTRGPR